MTGGGVSPEMEISDSENNDPLSSTQAGGGKNLKRIPSSDDISSDDELTSRQKPPKKKQTNLTPPIPNPPPQPPLSSTLTTPSSSSSQSSTQSKKSKKSSPSDVSAPRVKVYPDNASGSGPWVVFFRPKPNGKNLQVVQIMKDLARYTSVTDIDKVRPNKLRVVVTDRKHANAIVLDQHFSLEYRVYIPSRDVECEGVVTEESLTCETIKRDGVGMFKKLPSMVVQILDCQQLVTVSHVNGKPKYTPSNSYRVTFSGSALPDYVVIDKLRLKTRAYVPKPMICQNCKSVGHTAAYCNNKPHCSTCGKRHAAGETCTPQEPKCPFCGGAPHDLSACDVIKNRREKLKRSVKEKSKRSFAEILKGASPPVQQQQQQKQQTVNTSNVFDLLSDDELVADSVNAGAPFVFQGKSRRKNVTTPKVQGQVPPAKPSVNLPTKTSTADKQDQVPPGFRGLSSPLNGPGLAGTSQTPNVPFSFLPSVSTFQTGFFKLSDIVDGIFTFFNVPDSMRSIITAMLPIVKSLLQQLMQTWPLLAQFISLDV